MASKRTNTSGYYERFLVTNRSRYGVSLGYPVDFYLRPGDTVDLLKRFSREHISQAKGIERLRRAGHIRINWVRPDTSSQRDLSFIEASELGDLDDVTLVSPDDGDLLVYDGDTDEWENQPACSVVGLCTITVTSDYTATSDYGVILCDATSNDITVTLPESSESAAVRFYIKRVDSSANAVTVDAYDAETIDDETDQGLDPDDCMAIVCDGTEWHII
jgi:hypothetical protein